MKIFLYIYYLFYLFYFPSLSLLELKIIMQMLYKKLLEKLLYVIQKSYSKLLADFFFKKVANS